MLNPKNLKLGTEQYEKFNIPSRPGKVKSSRVQYDYRDHDGELFSCIAADLEGRRSKRDTWLKGKKERSI